MVMMTEIAEPPNVQLSRCSADLLMVVAALVVHRIHRWVRAVAPALVWVAALVVQPAVWSRWILRVDSLTCALWAGDRDTADLACAPPEVPAKETT
jgi:hypothetical protein